MVAVERTLVLLKPDAVARGLVGRVLQRFEDAGLKVVGTKMVRMDADLARKHYFDLEERFGKSVFDRRPPSCNPVRSSHWSWKVLRRSPTCGAWWGRRPNQATPGTIRGDFAHTSKAYTEAKHFVAANLIHAGSRRG